MRIAEWIAYLRKGLVAATGALGQLALALAPMSDAGEAVTAAEWVQVALAGLTVAGVVAFGNGPRPVTPVPGGLVPVPAPGVGQVTVPGSLALTEDDVRMIRAWYDAAHGAIGDEAQGRHEA